MAGSAWKPKAIDREAHGNPVPYKREAGLTIVAAALVAAATLAVYLQTLGHGFVNIDDVEYVVRNAPVRAGLTLKSIAWAFTSFHSANWHPLTWLSHMLDAQLFGVPPGGYAGAHHLTSLLLHIANSILLLMILAVTTRYLWKAALVASLFALHPQHVESVAWVAERKDVLSTFFMLWAIIAYVWYARRPSVGRYVSVALAFALGLMSKPMPVTLPVLLLLLDYWPLGRMGTAEEVADLVAFLVSDEARYITGQAINVCALGEVH